jgi:hypothetical protein
MGTGIAMQHDTPMSMPGYFLMMMVQKPQRVTRLCCVLMMSWTLHTKAINSGHSNGSRSSPGSSLWQEPIGWCTNGKSATKAVSTILMASNYLWRTVLHKLNMILYQILFDTFAVFKCANMYICRKFRIEFVGMFTVRLQTNFQKHSFIYFIKC